MDAAEWDDSALIHAFNAAMSKYQEMHGPSKSSKNFQEDMKFKSSLQVQGLAEQEQLKRPDESELRAEESNPHAVDREASADTGQEQQPAPEQPYFYDPAAVDGHNNLPGAEQYYAMQEIYYQLQQLELQLQVLRDLVESWSGVAGWNGMQHHANYGHPCQTQRGYPSACLPFHVSPHVYPCYCHYHCTARSSWPCGARSSCFPACAVHGQPGCCQSFLSPGCSQGHQRCQAQPQYCPAHSNPCQHVSKTRQGAGFGAADERQ